MTEAKPPPLFHRLALIGFGLIGGSIARAARAQGIVVEIVATARSAKSRDRVRELGVVDRVVDTNAEAVKDADLVIVCIPVGACGEAAREIAPHLKPGAIVSDVCSVKGAIVHDMGPHLPDGVHFVPAHPVAGTEHSGPDSGFAELFINRWCILTPPKGVDAAATEKLKAFWSALGARVEVMDADHHDRVLAITSHLPHLIAYTIVGTADELEQVTSSEVMQYSASGFRDFTRIAASDPTMWRDVFLTNKDAVLDMLGTFNEDLSKLTRAIRRGDGDALFEHFTRTRAIRRGIIQIGQDSPAPDFGRPRENLPPVPKPYAEE
jgi:cyclohexadieny/prephenate dehydrogenase